MGKSQNNGNIVVITRGNLHFLNLLPSNLERSDRIHKMLSAYNLLNDAIFLDDDDDETFCQETTIILAMTSFHSLEYLEAIQQAKENIHFGLIDDCAPFDGLWEYCVNICAGTLKACQMICHSQAKVACFPDGGRHHAQVEKASGFCWVNDCVIGINYCRKFFQRILYIDVDLHHGDAVQDAFYCSDHVFTFSIHRWEERGFWPNSGALDEEGIARGRFFNFNAPLKEGFRGKSFLEFAKRAVSSIVASAVKPQVIILQMGLDGLIGDPFACFSYDCQSMAEFVAFLAEEINLPLVVLGGGGYNSIACAKCWTSVVARLRNEPISNDIPETFEFIDECGPDFTLDLGQTKRKDLNSPEELENLLRVLQQRLTCISCV